MINELALSRAGPGHRRLAYCIAISTLTIAALLAVLDWPAEPHRVEPGPVALDLLLTREKSQPMPEPVEATQTDDEQIDDAAIQESDDKPVPEPAAEVTAAHTDDVAAPPVPAVAGDDSDREEIDWQVSLERASAETVEAHSKVDSLHPAFDELRRIAAVKYAEPRTGKPPPIWENVEKDIYGRTLLRHGNCFRVLDDMNVGNRYAFETFEQHLVFCDWGGKGRQEFPWIETIVARYPYLREPDGGVAAVGDD